MASSVQLLQFLQSDPHNLLLCAVVSVGVHLLQWFLYGVINKYIRPRKSVIEVFPAPYFNIGCLAVFSFGLSVNQGAFHVRKVIITALMGVYAARICCFLFYRNIIRQLIGPQPGSKAPSVNSLWLSPSPLHTSFASPFSSVTLLLLRRMVLGYSRLQVVLLVALALSLRQLLTSRN